MRPVPGETLADPASGTGGFLLAAHDYVAKRHGALDKDQWRHLRQEALNGWEIVANTARLCVMNLYLHGIGGQDGGSPIRVGDSLAADPGDRFDLVLTNPPFGKKSSVTFVNEAGETRREATTIVRRKPASATPWTQQVWIYDLRTNKEFTLKQNPLSRADLDEFVACYNPQNRHDRKATWSPENPGGRWRAYSYDEVIARDKVSLAIFWLRDESLEDSANLPEPDVLAAEIVQDLQAALEQFAAIAEDLEVER
jgi:type I restriction-modification system DNA methylase subunit